MIFFFKSRFDLSLDMFQWESHCFTSLHVICLLICSSENHIVSIVYMWSVSCYVPLEITLFHKSTCDMTPAVFQRESHCSSGNHIVSQVYMWYVSCCVPVESHCFTSLHVICLLLCSSGNHIVSQVYMWSVSWYVHVGITLFQKSTCDLSLDLFL